MRSKTRGVRRDTFQILYPRRCFVCDKALNFWELEAGIHPKCEKELYPVGADVCVRCGTPVLPREEYCNNCIRRNKKLPGITQGKALYKYRGKVKYVMYRFKYANKREYAYAFANKAKRYEEWIANNQIDVIFPVPMHKRKKRRRGYNQAECFAKELGKQFGIPVNTRDLCRSRDTNPMKTLSRTERYNNLKNAFQMKSNMLDYRKNALVVDDIYTTGATADAVAEVLLAAGFEKVYFLSICIGKGI